MTLRAPLTDLTEKLAWEIQRERDLEDPRGRVVRSFEKKAFRSPSNVIRILEFGVVLFEADLRRKIGRTRSELVNNCTTTNEKGLHKSARTT